MFKCPNCQTEMCIVEAAVKTYAAAVKGIDASGMRVGQSGSVSESGWARYEFRVGRQGRRSQNTKRVYYFGVAGEVKKRLKTSWVGTGEKKGRGDCCGSRRKSWSTSPIQVDPK